MIINNLTKYTVGGGNGSWPNPTVRTDIFTYQDKIIDDITYSEITDIDVNKYPDDDFIVIPATLNGHTTIFSSNWLRKDSTLIKNSPQGKILFKAGCRLWCEYIGELYYIFYLQPNTKYYIEDLSFLQPVYYGWGYNFYGFANLENLYNLYFKTNDVLFTQSAFPRFYDRSGNYNATSRYNDNTYINNNNYKYYDYRANSMPAYCMCKCFVDNTNSKKWITNCSTFNRNSLNDTEINLFTGNAIKMNATSITESTALAGLTVYNKATSSYDCFIDFINLSTIGGQYGASLGRASKKVSIILRYNGVVNYTGTASTLANITAIYVPDDQVANYQADAFWGTGTIKGISELPTLTYEY